MHMTLLSRPPGAASALFLALAAPGLALAAGQWDEKFIIQPVALQDQSENKSSGENGAGETEQAEVVQGPAQQIQEAPTVIPEEGFPVRISLGYYLYSDYVWRAKNLSEYAGEGREKPNHQMTTSISYAFKDFGAIGFDTFFEWFAAQRQLNPFARGDNLQEVDFVGWWQYFIEPITTNMRLSYTYDIFPNAAQLNRSDKRKGNNNDDRTQYYTVYLVHNDAWLWESLFPGNKEGILNPSFLFSHDFGTLAGVWMEFGLSHTFPVPGVENLTVTPGWKLYTDCNYWSRGFKLAGDQWALITAYNLSKALNLPKVAGELVLTGDLYFNNAFGTMEDNGVLHDEFWGGMSVRWSWGG
jgi:hypothetical protein